MEINVENMKDSTCRGQLFMISTRLNIAIIYSQFFGKHYKAKSLIIISYPQQNFQKWIIDIVKFQRKENFLNDYTIGTNNPAKGFVP